MKFDLIQSILSDLFSSFVFRNEYGAPRETLQGDIVRSKGEKIIANYFYNNHIRYVYEKEAWTRGWIFSERIARPDFYLPDYKVYVEYWGLVDADDHKLRSDYEKVMRWKMAKYYQNRIKFISIYPSNLDNLDRIFRTKFRGVMGFDID